MRWTPNPALSNKSLNYVVFVLLFFCQANDSKTLMIIDEFLTTVIRVQN